MLDPDMRKPFFYNSQWLVMARKESDIAPLIARHWYQSKTKNLRPWTDNYSNIVSILR